MSAVDDLQRWLSRARPGDAIEYYRGYLPTDRTCQHATSASDGLRCGRCSGCALDHYASALWGYGGGPKQLSEEWHFGSDPAVRLVQQRLAPGVYSYLSVKNGG